MQLSNTDEIKENVQRIAHDANKAAKIYYKNSSKWFKHNYKPTLTAAGIVTIAGLLGYFLTRHRAQIRRIK